MRAIKPVVIKNASFNVCKYAVALMIWMAFFLKMESLLVLTTFILGSSAMLGVDRAPMVLLGNITLAKFIPSSDVMLDANGMRFAHGLGFILNLICLLWVMIEPKSGWMFTLIIAVIKSISAVGYCSGLKLYQCMNNDSCCTFVKSKVGS